MSDIKDEVKYVPTPQQIALTSETEKELEKTITVSHYTEITNEIKPAFFDKETATLLGMIPFCVGAEKEIIYGCLPTMKIHSPTIAACTSFDILKRRKADEPIRLMSMHSICNSGLDGISEDFKVIWACLNGVTDADDVDKEICKALRLDDDTIPLEGTKDKPLLLSAKNLYQRLMYLDYFGMGSDHSVTCIIIDFLVMFLTRDGADVEMIYKIQKFCRELQRMRLAVKLPKAERASYILGALPNGFEDIKEDFLKLDESKATHLQISKIRPKPILCELGEFTEMTVEDVTGVNLLSYAEWWRKHQPPVSYTYSGYECMGSKTRMHDELVYLFYARVVNACGFDEKVFFGFERIIDLEFTASGCKAYKFKVYKAKIQNQDYLLVNHPGLTAYKSVKGSEPSWILLDQTPNGEGPHFLTDTDRYTVRLLKTKSM